MTPAPPPVRPRVTGATRDQTAHACNLGDIMNDDPLELLNFRDVLAADLAAGRNRPLAFYLREFPAAAEAVVTEYERAQQSRPAAGPAAARGTDPDALQQVRR